MKNIALVLVVGLSLSSFAFAQAPGAGTPPQGGTPPGAAMTPPPAKPAAPASPAAKAAGDEKPKHGKGKKAKPKAD